MHLCVLLRSAKLTATDNKTLTIRTFLFSPPLSAQAHACTASFCVCFFYRPRETEAHFTAAEVSSQRSQSDSFRFKRAAFYQSLKSIIGLAAAKAPPLCLTSCRSRNPSAHTLRLLFLLSPTSPFLPWCPIDPFSFWGIFPLPVHVCFLVPRYPRSHHLSLFLLPAQSQRSIVATMHFSMSKYWPLGSSRRNVLMMILQALS
jgi:hypothetical protein